jgi:hypothetical protein
MPRFPITRALVIVAVLALVAIAYSALATTWVAWVPTQTSGGTSATFGNYWGGASFMYSTQAVTWITPPMNVLGTATFDQVQNYLGSSGDALWVEFSSQSTSSNYLYQGTVTATATAAIGSGATFSSSYYGFAAFAVIDVSSETCGQLYFHADVKNTASSTGTFYGTYMFGNATWFYVTFYSASVASGSWFNPAVSGPNTCLSPGYYLYVATVYSTVAVNNPGAAQVGIGTTSEGTSYVPGTQYALNIAPASGDTMVFPWTTSASPYVKLMFTQSVVNTAGSSAPGSFSVTVSGSTYSASNTYTLLYFSDSATNTFPTGGQITPLNCPAGVYGLPTTVSTSVTKLLSCQSLSSPSSGSAVYPDDYGKYSSTATTFIPFSIPGSTSTTASFAVSYTDSASNTYSASTAYGFQPTNPSISSSNTQGYLAQLPQCSISSNPYSEGHTGTFGLFNCVAIEYGAISTVVWFYEPPGGQGVLLSFQNAQYSNVPTAFTPWLYVGTNGYLYGGDWAGSDRLVSTSSAISPGWHMAVIEEYYSGGTYYLSLYLDGSLVGQFSTSNLPQLFGANTAYAYNDIGTGNTNTWSATNNGWFFFNGVIAYVAVYNTVLSQSQVQQLYQAVFPNELFSQNLAGAYLLVPDWYNGGGYYFLPYFVNSQIMSQMGISNADATSITPSGSVGAIPSSQFMTIQLAVYISSFSITSSVPYAVYVHNPSITAGSTYYTPVPNMGWAYVGSGFLSSPSVSGSTNVTASLLGKPGISNYPTLSVNGSARFPFTSSTTSITMVFYQLSGDTETLGVTPNGLGVYFVSSNVTSYTIPSTPDQSVLTIPTTTGVYIGESLGDWWNVTDKPYYNLTLINGAGSTGSFTITVNGATDTASQFAWNQGNPPNAIVYFTGTDGYTYAFNPAWVQGLGVSQMLVGSSTYFVPTVIGETLTSTNLTFISQGTWLNETTVNNSFMTYYPLPSFINFLSTPIMMYVNGTTSSGYLTPALAIINNNLQQYTVQYMNITAWSNNGALMGVAIIQNPFSFIGFVSNGSLTPIFILLNSTAGVPPILFSYYPQIRYLLMPDTASVSYTLTTVYVNVPSQLFNSWSGNLVFGVSQAMQSGYFALVSGGFYAPPPTQFSLYVPTYLLNKLAQLFLASYPLSSTCTMLEVLSNPLETTICQGISQVVTINLGNTTVGKPAFGDVSGAFNIAPLTTSLSLEQIIAINAATAALVILFIKKHQSLPAGLMLGGAIALALGIFFWLEMEIGIGILLFVAGAALATTHRSQ